VLRNFYVTFDFWVVYSSDMSDIAVIRLSIDRISALCERI